MAFLTESETTKLKLLLKHPMVIAFIKAVEDSKKPKKLKTLEEHNKEKANTSRSMAHVITPKFNGIACPRCDRELVDSNPRLITTGGNSRTDVECPGCKYQGDRIV